MENLYKTFKTNKKLGIQQIADFFIHQYNVKTIKEAAPEMYYYDKGIYIRAEQKIETELSKLLEEDYSINHKREVIKSKYGVKVIPTGGILLWINGLLILITGYLIYAPDYLPITTIRIVFYKNSHRLRSQCHLTKK